MPDHPLAEVFGFPTDNLSSTAQRYRAARLCPFNNRVPSCTKDKANDPLGVCSIFERNGEPAIVCPVRFRESWLIADHAAVFFFPDGTRWTTLTEVRLNDANGQSAGNIDLVLVAFDDNGKVMDFGTVEIQAVYISGNVRRPFEHYMQDPASNWTWARTAPRPDYLSSSRKRLVPQLIYKGSILHSWGKKQAVVIHRGFYDTLPSLAAVPADESDMAWMIYDLVHDHDANVYNLTLVETRPTLFRPALDRITLPQPGPVDEFMNVLQAKLDQRLEDDTPDTSGPSLADLL